MPHSVEQPCESIRQWCLKFGADFARKLRRRRPKPGDTWHLDEVFLKINGELQHLWRAVDQHGVVLDILVQDRGNASAAKRFFKRLLAGLKYKPRRIVTDGLRSYDVAHREILPAICWCGRAGSERRHRLVWCRSSRRPQWYCRLRVSPDRRWCG